MRKLALEGPMEKLTASEAAQPALFATSLAVLDLTREAGIEPALVAGHSLGEYTAAVASGALAAEVGMELVSLRGRLTAEIQSERPGAMGALTGLPSEQVEELCGKTSDWGWWRPRTSTLPPR